MPVTGIDVNPNVAGGTSLDARELVEEFYLNESGRFRINTAIKRNWPNPGYLLVMSSTAQNPVDVDGRATHTIQAVGIAPTAGDVITIQATLDGATWVSIPVTSIAATPATTATITANGLFTLTAANYWKIQALVTPGTTTGATNVTIISKA